MSKVIFDMGARHPRSNDKPLEFVSTRIFPEGGLTIKEIVARMCSGRPIVESIKVKETGLRNKLGL